MFYIILYTLCIILIIHLVLYYMNIDIIQLYTHEKNIKLSTDKLSADELCSDELSTDELETSLNLLKEMNKNYTYD